MKRVIVGGLLLAALLATAVGGFALSVARYRECRRFGHSWFYCAGDR